MVTHWWRLHISRTKIVQVGIIKRMAFLFYYPTFPHLAGEKMCITGTMERNVNLVVDCFMLKGASFNQNDAFFYSQIIHLLFLLKYGTILTKQ